MSRIVNIGTQNYTQVIALDEPGMGGANHDYCVASAEDSEAIFADVLFQEGPIKESKINGCHNEDLIAIVLDRLEGFQSGNYACVENANAILNLKSALTWLNNRTKARQDRGVEGTAVV